MEFRSKGLFSQGGTLCLTICPPCLKELPATSVTRSSRPSTPNGNVSVPSGTTNAVSSSTTSRFATPTSSTVKGFTRSFLESSAGFRTSLEADMKRDGHCDWCQQKVHEGELVVETDKHLFHENKCAEAWRNYCKQVKAQCS